MLIIRVFTLILLITTPGLTQTLPPAIQDFPQDYRGIIHCHSGLSYDSRGKLSDVEKAAQEKKLNFVIMTDHFSPGLYEKSLRGMIGNTLFIAGAEISRSHRSSILAFPLPQHFLPKSKWSDNIAELKRLGSTVFLGHMELAKDDELRTVGGLEITNFHSLAVRGKKILLPVRFLQAIPPYNWDLRFLIDRNMPTLKRWRELEATEQKLIPAIAGNDTHDNYRLFQKFGPKLGSYNRTFRAITTHVWASELSENAIVEAVKNGRSYFAFEVFGRSNGFRFYATNGADNFLPGDTVIVNQELNLVVRLPENAQNVRVKIIKNGTIYSEKGGLSFKRHPIITWTVREPSIYQVEIRKGRHPWIFANAISVKKLQ